MKCPFCLNNNACSLNNGKACWCFNIKVPDDMLALIPLQKRGCVCICRQCIEFYCADRHGFLKEFNLVL
ncbi:MAG: cysteine-rich CWC family protein [Oceanospirillaceae bacterium]|nr:cysteine-rich CWC family protein [Oceanospirillaceae bacterium]